eukprot:PhF_6_TR4525/c0_g1_i2/m.6339
MFQGVVCTWPFSKVTLERSDLLNTLRLTESNLTEGLLNSSTTWRRSRYGHTPWKNFSPYLRWNLIIRAVCAVVLLTSGDSAGLVMVCTDWMFGCIWYYHSFCRVEKQYELERGMTQMVHVKREGEWRYVHRTDLVVGDLIRVGAGFQSRDCSVAVVNLPGKATYTNQANFFQLTFLGGDGKGISDRDETRMYVIPEKSIVVDCVGGPMECVVIQLGHTPPVTIHATSFSTDESPFGVSNPAHENTFEACLFMDLQ